MAVDCYIYADFSGFYISEEYHDPVFVKSRAGFVIIFRLLYHLGIQATGLNLFVHFSCGICSSVAVYEGLGSHENTG